MPPDANPVYGGPYLDQHVPDPDVPQSYVSANVNMPIIATDANATPAADAPASDSSAATRQTTEDNAEASTVSDNPDTAGFSPQTDSTEHL